MWQLNIPSALQLISHCTRSVALFLLCVCVCVFICTVGVMGVPHHLSQRHYTHPCPHPPTHTAVVVLVQVCVWFGGNLNQMRWCLSACGLVTSSIPKRQRDRGMMSRTDGCVEEKKEGKHCFTKCNWSIYLSMQKKFEIEKLWRTMLRDTRFCFYFSATDWFNKS